jgi:site-specific recombinase XerD
MLELLYLTGLRRAELARLLLFDLDATRGTSSCARAAKTE